MGGSPLTRVHKEAGTRIHRQHELPSCTSRFLRIVFRVGLPDAATARVRALGADCGFQPVKGSGVLLLLFLFLFFKEGQ